MGLMLTVRISGCLCIGLFCWLFGVYLEEQLKQRWMFLREMKELLCYLEKEMTYRRAPVETALVQAAENCHTVLRKILLSTAQEVCARRGEAFQSIWETQLNLLLPDRLLYPEQAEAVKTAGSALCMADTVLQRRMIETYTVRLNQLEEEAQQQYREKSRLYRRLSAAAGVFMILILI